MSKATMLFLACFSEILLVTAIKFADYEQGAKFDKCIAIEDWEGKGLDDDVTLQDRDANGCCNESAVPGVKHYSKYVGAQVVCGFKSDGKIEMKTSTSNKVKTCTYNQCYVWKQGLSCATGQQRLNGCCADASACTSADCGFKTGCKHYTYKNPNNKNAKYCLNYNEKYKMEYTSAMDDDQASDKLQIDKVYQYTKCSGGATGASSGTTGASGGAKTANASMTNASSGTTGASGGAKTANVAMKNAKLSGLIMAAAGGVASLIK